MAGGCGGTCEPAAQTRGFARGMAAGCGGTCEPAPQTRGLPRGMAAGWWGLGRGGGGPRGGFGHLGEGDGAVEVRVGAVAALLPAELGVEQVAAEAQHDEIGRAHV